MQPANPAPGPRGFTVTAFAVEGDLDGLVEITKANWSGHIVRGPKSTYPKLRTQSTLQRCGAYVLLGPATLDPDKERVYVGEGDIVAERLDDHLRHKDFWTHYVVVTRSSENLNKAFVRHLESKLIELARQAGVAEVENGTTPTVPPMTRAELADAESFLEHVVSILPMLGVRAFRKPVDSSRSRLKLQLSGVGASAKGVELPNGFLVFAGAVARETPVPTLTQSSRRLRDRMLSEDACRTLKEIQEASIPTQNAKSVAAGAP